MKKNKLILISMICSMLFSSVPAYALEIDPGVTGAEAAEAVEPEPAEEEAAAEPEPAEEKAAVEPEPAEEETAAAEPEPAEEEAAAEPEPAEEEAAAEPEPAGEEAAAEPAPIQEEAEAEPTQEEIGEPLAGTPGEIGVTPTGKQEVMTSFPHDYNDTQDPAYRDLREELERDFAGTDWREGPELPESYSLVSLPTGGGDDGTQPIQASEGREQVTSVKDQGDLNICWAYAGNGAVESSILKAYNSQLAGTDPDLSEWQLSWAYANPVSGSTIVAGRGVEASQYGEGFYGALGGTAPYYTYAQLVSSWNGAASEEDIPTPANAAGMYDIEEKDRSKAAVRVRDILFLSNPALHIAEKTEAEKRDGAYYGYEVNPEGIDMIKYFLKNNGAVSGILHYSLTKEMDGEGTALYNNWKYGSNYTPYLKSDTLANHGILIVGWDDSFDRQKFGNYIPPGNGAFLCKNSYGDYSASTQEDPADPACLYREGYFWLSYYDATLIAPQAFTAEIADENGKFSSDHLYMHDYTGMGNSFNAELREGVYDRDTNGNGKIERSETARSANVFTAQDNEMLTSVGVMVESPRSVVETWVYLLKSGFKDPEDGELIFRAADQNSYKSQFAGYQVLDLMRPIALQAGQVFSVVTRILGAKGSQIPVEAAGGGRLKKAAAGAGESYVQSGGTWKDIRDLDLELTDRYFDTDMHITGAGNVILRAMTKDAADYRITDGNGTDYKRGSAQALLMRTNSGSQKLAYVMLDGKLLDPDVYRVGKTDQDIRLDPGFVKRLGPGEHSIMFVYGDGWASGVFTVSEQKEQAPEEKPQPDEGGEDPGESAEPEEEAQPQAPAQGVAAEPAGAGEEPEHSRAAGREGAADRDSARRSPDTGDGTRTEVWLLIMLCAGAALCKVYAAGRSGNR